MSRKLITFGEISVVIRNHLTLAGWLYSSWTTWWKERFWVTLGALLLCSFSGQLKSRSPLGLFPSSFSRWHIFVPLCSQHTCYVSVMAMIPQMDFSWPMGIFHRLWAMEDTVYISLYYLLLSLSPLPGILWINNQFWYSTGAVSGCIGLIYASFHKEPKVS